MQAYYLCLACLVEFLYFCRVLTFLYTFMANKGEQKPTVLCVQRCLRHDLFGRFDRIRTCDGQTDGQTQATAYRASMASHGTNPTMSENITYECLQDNHKTRHLCKTYAHD